MKMPRNLRQVFEDDVPEQNGYCGSIQIRIFQEGWNNLCNVGCWFEFCQERAEGKPGFGSQFCCYIPFSHCNFCKVRQKVGLDELLAMGSDCQCLQFSKLFGSFTLTFNAEPFQWSGALEDSPSDEKVDPATSEKASETISAVISPIQQFYHQFSICLKFPFSSCILEAQEKTHGDRMRAAMP